MTQFEKTKRTLYGRQKTHKLSARQQHLVDTKLNELRLDLSIPYDELAKTFPSQELWIEIGFGGGEHLAAMAARNENVTFIGCEPFINGVAKLLVAIEEKGLTNIRIFDDDAHHLLNWLPNASTERIFVLYPDPWPKKRHHKRRFISSETLGKFANIMSSGADLLIASDIGDYIRTSLIALASSKDLFWTASAARDWSEAPDNWPGTRYEQKAIKAGRIPTYLKIKRL